MADLTAGGWDFVAKDGLSGPDCFLQQLAGGRSWFPESARTPSASVPVCVAGCHRRASATTVVTVRV